MAGFGFGEAASAIALAQTGFSLARALNSYISDLGDANDDILDLSSDIDSTCRYLRDLAGIIEKNETTKILSDDGIENAKKCVRDSERAITKMRKLLKKATASDTAAEVRPDEIDVSKFAKAKWPFLKPELEVRRRELQSIKLDINILYASYNAKASPDAADRARAEDDLPRLARTRKLMKQQVVDAKRRRDRKSKDSPQIPQPRRKESYGGYYDPPLYNRRSYSDDGSVEDAFDEFIYWNIEDLEKDFEDWAREKEDKRKRAEEETKRLQDRAVEKWKEEQTKEAMRLRREVEENREKLKSELTRTELRLAPQQIEDALNNVYPWPQAGNDLALTPPANQGQSSDADTGSVHTSNSVKSRSRSIWSRLSWAGRPKNNHVNGRHHPEIPELLRDHKAPGGVAELKAFYYQKLSSWKGLDFSVLEMEIPTQWLLNTLIAKEEKYLQDRKVNSIWKEFAQLPYDYRYVIDSHISRARSSTEHGGSWVLIYVECQRLEKSSLKLSRKRDVTGVYAVFKKATNSSPAHMLAAADIAFKDDDSISEWSRGSKYRDAENDSVKSDSDKDKLTPRRASVLEPEFKSRSRFDSHGRDHSHIAKRASRSFNRSGYDDPGELRRHHSDQTRSRSKGKDFMPIYEPPIEMHIPDHYLSVDGNPLAPGGSYYDIGPPPPPPRRDARLWERRRRDEYTNTRPYQPSGTPGPFNPSNPADKFSEFYSKPPRHREYQDRAERHTIPYNEPLSQTAPFDVHYGTTPPFREVPPRPRPYLDPYADMSGDRNYSSDPPPPPIPRRSTSGSYEDKRARFSNNLPAVMNRIPQRPTRRSTDDSSDPPPRHRIIESMDSFPSRLKPDTRFKYNPRPRPPTGPILSDIMEASDDIRHHSDNDSDVSTNSLSSNSSGSVWGYKSRDQSVVERERAREKENDNTTETADVKEIGREILAKLTTDTTTISTEDAKRNPMGEGQTQAQVQEHNSSVPDENSPRLPSAMGMFGVGLVEEPFDHAVGQKQDEDAGAREGGGQEDTADKTNLRSTDKRT